MDYGGIKKEHIVLMANQFAFSFAQNMAILSKSTISLLILLQETYLLSSKNIREFVISINFLSLRLFLFCLGTRVLTLNGSMIPMPSGYLPAM
jgi:hypothetical protein